MFNPVAVSRIGYGSAVTPSKGGKFSITRVKARIDNRLGQVQVLSIISFREINPLDAPW